MGSWSEFSGNNPELARVAEDVFAARRMKVLATLRPDGRPRLSELSGAVVRDGELWLAVIPSAKERDLERDPRCSIHCGSPGDEFGASARASGRAIRAEATDFPRVGFGARGAPPTFSLYRIELDEVVVTRPDPDTGQILIEWWSSEGGAGRLVRPGG